MVRGPMIAEVTAGCSSTNASARCASDSPCSSASAVSGVDGLELAGVLRQLGVVAGRLPAGAGSTWAARRWPRRYRPDSQPPASGLHGSTPSP